MSSTMEISGVWGVDEKDPRIRCMRMTQMTHDDILRKMKQTGSVTLSMSFVITDVGDCDEYELTHTVCVGLNRLPRGWKVDVARVNAYAPDSVKFSITVDRTMKKTFCSGEFEA